MQVVRAARTPDAERVQAFIQRLLATYSESMVTLMIDLAHRTGLLETLAGGAGTSEELAERAGLVERYVRECLAALVTAGIVEYEPAIRMYHLPAEHAVCLTGPGSLNLAPTSRLTALLATHVDQVAHAFRHGGGVPYEEFRPGFTDVMDEASRVTFDSQLIEGILPLARDVSARLAAGVRVADVGCGTGHTVNLMARAYPASQFTGYDLATDAIERARTEAAEWGLDNASFEVQDAATISRPGRFGVVFAFDAIHDQVDPAGVLSRIRQMLQPRGIFVMYDIKAASALEDNLDHPLGPWLYAVSTLHCMTVSLAAGGAGLGTAWGKETAVTMLADAGFENITVHDVPDDPFNVLYTATTPD
jgi:2-polyprenyl-3-methyl-5-hydroxy-6-metoxy-1,4-benzoquinol methylase